MKSAMIRALIPGGGHLYLGETATALGYAGTMGALATAGWWLESRNDSLNRPDEVNSFYLLAIKEWELSFFTTYRNAHRNSGLSLQAAGIDPTPVPQLVLAPFRRENLFDGAVLAAAGLALGLVAASSAGERHRFDAVSRVGMLGTTLRRNEALALYGADTLCLSLAAATAEEAFWRGILHNELEAALGPRRALQASSILFGLAHLVDLDGSLSIGRAAFGTAAGWYLGSLFQADRHRLARPIAAHFWYDFTVMFAGFLLDPDDNPLGVKVSFRY
ncbi:MAG TPA: CPBP family intramembrane metalloprotease [Kiritimatiellae bacterium]|nr:CPBP family intramembrane metalloprotease [Kiritimatiellia bacterium]